MDSTLLALAFSAGLMSFFSPCNFPLLPAYVSFFITERNTDDVTSDHIEDSRERDWKARIKKGLMTGMITVAGFFTVFIIIGFITAGIGSVLSRYFVYLAVFVGIIIIILGVLLLLDRKISFTVPIHFKNMKADSLSYYIFGLGYSIASLACVFPVFLMVVLTTLTSQGLVSGMMVFMLYASGMSLMMIAVTILITFSKHEMLKRFRKIMPHVNRISGIILILAGLILINQELLLKF